MDRFETELSEQEQKMEALEDTCLALVHSLQELEGAVRQQGAASGVRDDVTTNPPSTRFFVNLRSLMGCPLGSVACYLCHAVLTFAHSDDSL